MEKETIEQDEFNEIMGIKKKEAEIKENMEEKESQKEPEEKKEKEVKVNLELNK